MGRAFSRIVLSPANVRNPRIPRRLRLGPERVFEATHEILLARLFDGRVAFLTR